MSFIPISECSGESSHVSVEETVIRMSSIFPLSVGEELWDTEFVFKESISESMTMFVLEISEETITIDSSGSE